VLTALWTSAAAAQCLSAGEARAAVAQGRALRLSQVNQLVRRQAMGEVIRARLCRAGGQLVYEVVVLSADGRAMRLVVDAGSGAVVNRY